MITCSLVPNLATVSYTSNVYIYTHLRPKRYLCTWLGLYIHVYIHAYIHTYLPTYMHALPCFSIMLSQFRSFSLAFKVSLFQNELLNQSASGWQVFVTMSFSCTTGRDLKVRTEELLVGPGWCYWGTGFHT